MEGIIVFTTTDSREVADRIARGLVESGAAACVQIVPGVRSVYRWQGKVCEEGEWLLIIKSVAEKFEALRRRVRELHTYEVPEIVCVAIADGDPDYLKWLSGA